MSTTASAPNADLAASTRPRSLTPRDLITVGVFTALYFVIGFAFGFVGVLGPVAQAVGMIVSAAVNGIVFSLYITRIRKPGMVLLTGLIAALLMVLTGHAWTTLVAAVVFSGIAELILARGHYRSARAAILAYAFFTLWVIGPIVPMYYQRDAYLADIAEQMGDAYAAAWETVFSPGPFAAILAVIFVSACLGGLLGQKMLRKHFIRAGIA
ncbi:MptD family putative ECF transporter S component [Actinomyces qiguomingii]|uniref:MptD family putative ECF transporter S component n=1 Tax=Actinomyces qiguomingii TaxID=2057800 RepID=UPI000CA0426A|nr:MptD family putative ECF transporter S component [Actinomyces qiguomingii]